MPLTENVALSQKHDCGTVCVLFSMFKPTPAAARPTTYRHTMPQHSTALHACAISRPERPKKKISFPLTSSSISSLLQIVAVEVEKYSNNQKQSCHHKDIVLEFKELVSTTERRRIYPLWHHPLACGFLSLHYYFMTSAIFFSWLYLDESVAVIS